MFEIETAGQEIGTALLSDVEYLLDHAAEHHATMKSVATTESFQSPGWSAVTLYYWAFFDALALTRLVGRTVWFLDREAVTNLGVLSSSGDVPSRGIFQVSLESYVNATDRTVRLKRRDGTLHEACWIVLWTLFDELLKHSNFETSSTEYRTIRAITDAARALGPDWPSAIRNAVNYRPGCGYREVLDQSEIEIGKVLRKNPKMSLEEIVDRFETAILRIDRKTPLHQQTRDCCELLLVFTLLLNSVCFTLHDDLVTRQSFDVRWRDLRRRFLRRHQILSSGVTWPYSD